MLYYKKLFSTNFEEKIERLFLDSGYHLPSWSAKYEGSWQGESQISNKVVFGDMGKYDIEDGLKDKGLGSYLIDSLLVWAKKNYGKATIEILIGSSNDSEENKNLLAHFYGKRNIKRGAIIEETKDYLDNNPKTERISCEELIANLLNGIRSNAFMLSDYERENSELHRSLSESLKKERWYQMIIFILVLIILVLLILKLL